MIDRPPQTSQTLPRSKHRNKYTNTGLKVRVGYCFTIRRQTFLTDLHNDQNQSNNDTALPVINNDRPSQTFQAYGGDKTALAGDGDNSSVVVYRLFTQEFTH
jgi:hypothetical protein